jgi:hypothetical protein
VHGVQRCWCRAVESEGPVAGRLRQHEAREVGNRAADERKPSSSTRRHCVPFFFCFVFFVSSFASGQH